MNISAVSVIIKKRDGIELSAEEIDFFIQGVVDGSVADYQASAFLMAVFLKGMTLDETVALTRSMVNSGEHYDLSSLDGPKVDKHSTGGVGDKISIVLAPLATACGLKVPMMSGRGLGFSGGTLDKLESISGFDVNSSRERFFELMEKTGCTMIGQSAKIAPADRKLYALRDVTGTVECIPLICASILSKKIAEGTENLVLDVKVGNGAFMTNKSEARKLAKALIRVGKKLGLPVRAMISNMDQPLGQAVGNALEIKECLAILQNEQMGKRVADVKELSIQLCAHMLDMAGTVKSLAEGRKLALKKLADGSAWRVFEQIVSEQGGSVEQIKNPEKLPTTDRVVQWHAPKKGYFTKINTRWVGTQLVDLGGGRKKASDKVDPAVGFIFHKKLGASIKAGEALVSVHLPAHVDETQLATMEADFQSQITISNVRRENAKLIQEIYQ